MQKEEVAYTPVLSEVYKPPTMIRNLGDFFDFSKNLRIVKIFETPHKETHFIVCTQPNPSKCERCVSRSLCDSPCTS